MGLQVIPDLQYINVCDNVSEKPKTKYSAPTLKKLTNILLYHIL